MIRENGNLGHPESLRVVVESMKKNPSAILSAMEKVNKFIAPGIASDPEKEEQFINKILERVLPTTRVFDEEMRPYVKKIIDEKNASITKRNSGLKDNEDYDASIGYMIEHGGEAPPKTEKDLGAAGLSKSGDLKKDSDYIDRMSDHEYFLVTGTRREK